MVIIPLLAVLQSGAEGSTLALLQSKNLEPYQRASQSFETTLGANVRRFDLSSEPEAVILEKIRRLGPQLIVAVGTDALRVAAEKFSNLPVVFLMVLEAQHVPSRPAPMAGVVLEVPAGAQIEALMALRPGMKSVGVVYDPNESGPVVERLSKAAAQYGITLSAKPAATPKEAMAAMPALFERCDAFIIVPDRTTAGESCFELAVLLSLRHRVPLFSPSRKFVEKGALAAFSTDYEDVGAQAAGIANRLLAGQASPANETPRLLNLIVNRSIAGKIGVEVPKRFQARDVEVLS